MYFIQSKAAFLVFSSSFASSFSRLDVCTLSEARQRKKRRSITVNDHQALFWFQPKQRASMTFTFVLSECIWRANISKHEIQMSICTVTQTMKWLHVAAGRRPAAREWSAGEGASTNISGLFFFFRFSPPSSCETQLPCGDNEMTFPYSSCKFILQTNWEVLLMLKTSYFTQTRAEFFCMKIKSSRGQI